MTLSTIKLRSVTNADLIALNQVIEAAVMSWNLPHRVKRLALSVYCYDQTDLKYLNIIISEHNDTIVGVAAWDKANPNELPGSQHGLLLHSIYVHPDKQHKGIGSQLFKAVEKTVKALQLDGLLVKAQADADKFFIFQGMTPLEVKDPQRDYSNRFWKSI